MIPDSMVLAIRTTPFIVITDFLLLALKGNETVRVTLYVCFAVVSVSTDWLEISSLTKEIKGNSIDDFFSFNKHYGVSYM